MSRHDSPTNHALTQPDTPPDPTPRPAVEAPAVMPTTAKLVPELEPYQDPRPKQKVADPVFAEAVGLIDAILTQLGGDDDLAAPYEIALTFAVIELEDHGALTPAEPVAPDVRGQDPRELLAKVQHLVAALIAGSADLATTLRYLNVQEMVRTAQEDLAKDHPDDTSGARA